MAMREQMTVERLLIWAYQAQMVDLAGGGRGFGRGVDMVVAVGERASLGCAIDGGGCGGLFAVHQDAEAIHSAVLRLGRDMIGLVIRHAKAGTRPDWLPGAVPTVYPIFRSNGKILVERDPKSKGRELWCPFRIDPRPEHIDFCQAVYALWWDALALLVQDPPRLENHKMLPLDAPREPWMVSRLDFGEKP